MRNIKGQFLKGSKPICGFTSETAKKYGFKLGNKMRLGMKNSEKQKEIVRNYMKTRKITDETRLKMSLASKKQNHSYWLGKKVPYKPRPKMKGKLIGNKSPTWKGGVTSLDRLERVKFKKTIQKLVLERDCYKCVLCGSKGDLQVDHIQSWAKYVELRFNINNCRTLCKSCHYQITYGRPIPNKNMEWGHNLGKARV